MQVVDRLKAKVYAAPNQHSLQVHGGWGMTRTY